MPAIHLRSDVHPDSAQIARDFIFFYFAKGWLKVERRRWSEIGRQITGDSLMSHLNALRTPLRPAASPA